MITTNTDTYTVKTKIKEQGFQIPADAVLETYRGRPGCGCGCRGTYSTTKHAITRRSKFINELLAAPEMYSIDLWANYGDNGEDVACFGFTDEETTVWVYVNITALEVLR